MRCASGANVRIIDQFVGCGLQILVCHAFADDAPLERLTRRDPLRSHHNVLGPGDADHLLQRRRSAGSGDLAELLLGQGILSAVRSDAEIAGQ